MGCLCGNFALKYMLDMRKCREWAVDRSQNMGPNYGKFFGHLGQSVKPKNLCGLLGWNKSCFGVYKIGNG